MHRIADKAHSRKPLFTLSDPYALGLGRTLAPVFGVGAELVAYKYALFLLAV
jgi:hypothetical protein